MGTRVLLILDLVCTFPIVFSSGREIVERALDDRRKDFTRNVGKQKDETVLEKIPVGVEQNIARVTLVGLTFLVGKLPNFGLATNLVGGLAQCSMAFILPPAIWLKLNADNPILPSSESAPSKLSSNGQPTPQTVTSGSSSDISEWEEISMDDYADEPRVDAQKFGAFGLGNSVVDERILTSLGLLGAGTCVAALTTFVSLKEVFEVVGP